MSSFEDGLAVPRCRETVPQSEAAGCYRENANFELVVSSKNADVPCVEAGSWLLPLPAAQR
jgi:hypothetical protein